MFAEGDRTDSVPENLVETVREFLRPLAGHLTRQGIELVTRLEPVTVAIPLKRIKTILERLTNNAMEAMPGGTLCVHVHEDNGQAVLLVADTGVGTQTRISPGSLNRSSQPRDFNRRKRATHQPGPRRRPWGGP